MASWQLVVVVAAGVAALIAAVMWLRIHPFVALLAVAIGVGLAAGMPPQKVIESITAGMGNTLGFVAVVVGLGSIFGMMLEESGGAEKLAERLVAICGPQRAALALGLVGFLVCIPVFLDVALVMLLPLAVAAARRTGEPVTRFALPMLAGMAVTHAFVPPTPGPTAVANLLGADLGWVITVGILAGLPTLAITAVIASRVLAQQAAGNVSDATATAATDRPQRPWAAPHLGVVVALLVLPLALIVGDTGVRAALGEESPAAIWLTLVGHPFTALLIATLGTFYFLGIRLGMPAAEVQRIAERALEPAGVILLVTGAGGVFKQVLIDSGAGQAVAASLTAAALPTVVVAWLVAAVIRVLQGSATVAMITAAGLVAPLVESAAHPEPFAALVTIAIASGGTVASHVNDSGFWLVGKFLGLSVGDTLRTWTVQETIIGVLGLMFVVVIAATAGVL
jgi:Gnt-I system low-affinity gluconate transporter